MQEPVEQLDRVRNDNSGISLPREVPQTPSAGNEEFGVVSR